MDFIHIQGKTPFSRPLPEGRYEISTAKRVIKWFFLVYEFDKWEDGNPNPERIFHLKGPLTIEANYKFSILETLKSIPRIVIYIASFIKSIGYLLPYANAVIDFIFSTRLHANPTSQ